MVKIRTYKKRVNKMLHWYTEQVSLVLPNADFTRLANTYRAEAVLAQIQAQRQHEEPQVQEWFFPVKTAFDYTGTRPVLSVYIPQDWELTNLLYLDFDEV